MRILITTDSFYPLMSGVLNYVIVTANTLVARGHHIDILATRDTPKIPRGIINPQVKIHYVDGKGLFFYPEIKFTSIIGVKDVQRIKRIKPDIIYFQTPGTLGLKSIILARMFAIPLVGIFHTRIASKEYLSYLGNLGKTDTAQYIAWAYTRYCYNSADLVISPSIDIKKELQKHQITTPITVINNAIDHKKIKRKTSPHSIKKPAFVYVGRVSRDKNLSTLIAGFMLAHQKNASIKLYIIGEGHLRKKLEETVRKKHASEYIHILGPLENKILLETRFLEQFTAFVTMSNTEVQPISIIEALFRGLPIIGPDTAGIRELAEGNGILVKKNSPTALARAVLDITRNPKLREKLSQSSLTRAKKHTAEAATTILEDALAQCITHARSKAR